MWPDFSALDVTVGSEKSVKNWLHWRSKGQMGKKRKRRRTKKQSLLLPPEKGEVILNNVDDYCVMHSESGVLQPY